MASPGHPAAGPLTAPAPPPDGAAPINGPPEAGGRRVGKSGPHAGAARNRADQVMRPLNGRAVRSVILTRPDADGIVPKVSGMEKSTSTDFFHGAVRSRKGRMNPGLVAGHPMDVFGRDVFGRQKTNQEYSPPPSFIQRAGLRHFPKPHAWRACTTSSGTWRLGRGKVAPNARPRRNLIPECQRPSVGWCADRR